jgi:hypothetical protein
LVVELAFFYILSGLKLLLGVKTPLKKLLLTQSPALLLFLILKFHLLDKSISLKLVFALQMSDLSEDLIFSHLYILLLILFN